MCNRRVSVPDVPARHNALVHRTLPSKMRRRFQQPLTVTEKSRSALLIKTGVVRQHDDIGCAVQLRFERKQFLTVGRQKHIIRIQPQRIVHARLCKRKIACGSKIIAPREHLHSAVFFGNFPRFVGRAGVRDANFIRNAAHAVQTSREHLLLIAYDHAKADGRHSIPPNQSMQGE